MKNNLSQKLKWIVRPTLYSIKIRMLNRNANWVLGRVACMGQDTFKLLNIDVPIQNIQKGRVDYLNDLIAQTKFKARTNQIIPHIIREDIKGLVLQQQVNFVFKRKPPIALYMDSYSELTDQRFYYKKDKWSFCANYSDINHSLKFKNTFDARGLLSVDELYDNYQVFFKNVRVNYGLVPIFFLHFPVKLDKREKFQTRYSKIKEAIDKVKTEFEPFYSIEADENIVEWPEERLPGLENFPYHYNKSTYKNLADKIRACKVFKKRE